jgi:hypothetical protein
MGTDYSRADPDGCFLLHLRWNQAVWADSVQYEEVVLLSNDPLASKS